MVGSFLRLAAAGVFCLFLAGCASDPGDVGFDGGSGARMMPDTPLQCVPYAREKAGIPIYGDAYTWWNQAAGRYARTNAPREGAVLVLTGYAGPARAHLAVVREVVDARIIRVDHANWLDDGAIYTDDPVRDVSPENDWSKVRVFNLRTGAWGSRIYPVQGFIGPGPGSDSVQMAQNPPPARRDAIAALLAEEAVSDDDSE